MVQIFRQIISWLNLSTNLAPKSSLLKIKWKNSSNPKVLKFLSQHNLKTQQKLDMSRKLKELYENPFFHGIKTKDEAEALWKESQNPEADLWFAMESKDQILTYIYQGSSHDPINLYSGSFLRCHLMIANYRVKKFIRKPQYVIKINSFDWELLDFDDIKKIFHIVILIHVLSWKQKCL